MSTVPDKSPPDGDGEGKPRKRRYLSPEELNDAAANHDPKAEKASRNDAPCPGAAEPPENLGYQGVGGPLYAPPGKRTRRPSYRQLAKLARENPYHLKQMVAQGAESVLYEARVDGHTLCVKSIRNFLGRQFAHAAGRDDDGKLDDVSYATKVRHLRNEFEVGKHLQEDGDVPVVNIYALRKVRRLGVEIGYDLLLEYVAGHDMGDKHFLARLSTEDKINVLYQTLLALQFLHSKRYVHMDMKPSNIMVDSHKQVKLIDFGVTVVKGHQPQSVTGTTGYLSPEQIVKESLTEATDIFSLGVTFAVIFGNHPLRQSQDELKSKQFRSTARFHLDSVDQPAITQFPELADYPDLAECLSRCTIPKRDKRIEDVGVLMSFIERLANKRGFPLNRLAE